MNAKAAAALYEAERMGVRQIKHALWDYRGGYCAGGVLIKAQFGSEEWNPTIKELAAMTHEEWTEMIEMNNAGCTFAEIARKLGPDSA
jgi:hypothetical protein